MHVGRQVKTQLNRTCSVMQHVTCIYIYIYEPIDKQVTTSKASKLQLQLKLKSIWCDVVPSVIIINKRNQWETGRPCGSRSGSVNKINIACPYSFSLIFSYQVHDLPSWLRIPSTASMCTDTMLIWYVRFHFWILYVLYIVLVGCLV